MSENGREEMGLETSYAALDRSAVDRAARPGEPSPFSCPAPQNALDGQAESVETALVAALRALGERASLARRIARRHHTVLLGRNGS